jgi:hypothetical protein
MPVKVKASSSSVLMIMVVWTYCSRSLLPMVYNVEGYVMRLSCVRFASLHRRQDKCLLRQSTTSNEKSTLLIDGENQSRPMDFNQTFNKQIGFSNDTTTLIDPYSTASTWSTPTLLESAESRIPGSKEGYYITRIYKINPAGFDLDSIPGMKGNDLYLKRLEITTRNVSVPVALMMLDPIEYPSRSQAIKACRKANIVIYRGPIKWDMTDREVLSDTSKCQRARVGDRVFPGDVLACQIRIGDGVFPAMHHRKPPFELPVIFEDDHFAIGRYICATSPKRIYCRPGFHHAQ